MEILSNWKSLISSPRSIHRKSEVKIYKKLSSFLGERVLVLAPHPDDESLGCGGSLLLHRKNKDHVKVVVLSDGSKGDFFSNFKDKQTYCELRESESLKALQVLNISDYDFFRLPDQELHLHQDFLEQKLSCLLKAYNPSLIYAPSNTEGHVDHQSISQIIRNVVFKHTQPLKILFYEVDPPTKDNCWVDISSVIQTKIKVCNIYKSQNKILSYTNAAIGLNMFRAKNFPSHVKYVEAFQYLKFDPV